MADGDNVLVQWNENLDVKSVTLPYLSDYGDYKFIGWYTQSTGGNWVSYGGSYKPTGDVTLYARYVYSPSYTLTVNPNNGSAKSYYSLTEGETKVITTPTRPGYTFNNWTLSGSGSSISGTTFKMGYADATLTANWVANGYTVKYNGNGATGGSTANSSHTYDVAKNLTANGFTRSYTVTYNPNYTGSTNVAKTATYAFKNWNTNSSGTGTSYSNSQSVTNLASTNGATVNLYAQWTPTSVTYVPTRTGYTFGGWYTSSDLSGSRVDTSGTYTPTGNITLYAKWTANTYTIKYNGNGATGGSTADSSHIYDVAKNLTANGFTRNYTVTYNHNYTGSANSTKISTYTFKNWNSVAEGTGTTYTNSQSVTNLASTNGAIVNLYAQWTPASVTYVPTRTGYTFAGWYTASDLSGSRVDTNGVYTPTANITLYAKWTANAYTVKYNGNGATGGSTADSSHAYDVAKNLTANGFTRNYTITYNHNYTGSANVDKTSTYAFKNWNTNSAGTGTSYSNSQSVTNLASTNGATVNLYAQWTPTSVTYVPSRTGYTFDGWFTSSDLSGSRVDTNGVYTPTGNITLYAKWTATAYTVKYNGNGATGGSMADSSHTYDVAKNLTANGFTRNYTVTYNHNYTGSTNTSKTSTYGFKNWNSVAEGTGTTYTNSQSVTNLASTNGAIVNLYAQWTPASVTYVPTRTGYIFAGWYTASDLSGSRVDTNGVYTPTGNITLYAKWTANAYTVKYNGNGATGGSTADSSHTYDVAKNLTANGFTRNYTVTYNHNYSGSTNSTKTSTYTFKNWNSVAGGTGTTYTNSQSVTNLTNTNGDVVNLYAQWTPVSVTYIPTRSGYTFGGWYITSDLSGSRVDTNGVYTPTANITLYAKWTTNAYTVKYNGNGSTGGSTADSSHTYDVAKNLTANGFTRNYTVTYNHNYSGTANETKTATYTFKNWNTNSAGTGTSYSNSQSVINLASTNGAVVNLYAQWTPATVTYVPTRIGYIFDGWYTMSDATGSRVDTNGSYIPTGNVTLYAKWIKDDSQTKKIKYSIEYYKDNILVSADTKVIEKTVWSLDSDTLSVDKTQITSDSNKYDGYVIDYTDPATIPDTIDNNGVIKLYYSKRSDLTYKVNYLEKGTNVVLHEQRTVNNQVFKTVINSSNEVISIDGYVYDSVDKENLEITTGENVINVYYVKRADLSFVVNYLEKGTNVVLHDPETVNNQVYKQVVYSLDWLIAIDGYVYDSVDKDSLEITTGENVINIYYINRTDLSYVVNYLEKDTNVVLHNPKTVNDQVFKMEIFSDTEVIDIDGYNFDSIDKDVLIIGIEDNVINIYYTKRTDLSYVVNYLEKDTGKVLHEQKVVNNQTFKSAIKPVDELIPINGYNYDSVDKDVLIIGTGENVINIYYTKRTDLTYKVNYLEKGTENVIHDQKVVNDVVFETVINSANEVITIYGYDYDSVDKDSLTIGTDENVINIYYTKKDTSVLVHYYIEGTEEKLSEDVEIPGKVFDLYTTNEATDIESKWELAYVPENKNGEMTEEQIVVNYYYRKKAARVIVHYYEEGTTNKLSENVTIEGRVDNAYETEAATDIPIKYELVGEPENKTGTMTEEEINVYYYYRVKDGKIIVKYINQDTNEEIMEQSETVDKVDANYKVILDKIDGYTLINVDGELEGKIEINPIIITCYYRKIAYVRVKYIDKATGESLDEEVNEGFVGDDFTSKSKPFTNYVLIDEPPEKTVKFSDDEIVLIYYYSHVSGGVIEKHIDKISGQILSNDVHDGNEGDEYNILSKTFPNYDLVEDELPDNSSGKMAVDPIEVTYYYIYRTKVVSEYIDMVTGEKVELDETIDGYESEEYQTEQKEIKGYVLVKAPDNEVGIMDKTETLVKYYYARISSGITVNYIDINTGKDVHDEFKETGYEGKDYETHEENVDGYDLVMERYPDNAKGKMAVDEINIVYYYIRKSNVVIKYIDKISGEEIADKEERVGHEGDSYTTEAKDIEGYDLVADPENKDGEMGPDTIEVIYYYVRPAKVIVNYYDADTKEKVSDSETINAHEGDTYKTDEKDVKYYKLTEKPENADGIIKLEADNDTIVVNYYYKKKEFNLQMKKELLEIVNNGQTRSINSDIAKIEMDKNKINSTDLVVRYRITVINDSELYGNAVIEENIPSGMEMRPEENKEWMIKDGKVTLKTKDIEPGQSVSYNVVLRWIPGNDNLGMKENTVKIVETENEAGFDEADDKDDMDIATVILSLGTGTAKNDYTLLNLMMLLALMILAIVLGFTIKKAE